MMGKFETACNEYRENKRLIEELEAMNEEIKAAIIEMMGGRDKMTEGAAKASNIIVTSSRLDSKALKADMPEVFNRYNKQSSYRRFTVQ